MEYISQKHLLPTLMLMLIITTTILRVAECSPRHHGRDKPNIVVFILDDVGFGDLGCYGNDTMDTPHMDRLAEQGARMTHHIVHPMCTPSRAALMTGRYPIRSGMASYNRVRIVPFFYTSATGLPSNETTIAELVKDVGYSTALIGKWHLGIMCDPESGCSDPNSQGFDYFYGIPSSNLFLCGSLSQFLDFTWTFFRNLGVATTITLFSLALLVKNGQITKKMFFRLLCFLLVICPLLIAITYVSLVSSICLLMENGEVVEQPTSYENLTQRHTQRALEFIDSNTDRPFLLVMSFAHAHTAQFAEPHFSVKSRRGLYGAAVSEMDWSIGEIMKKMDKYNLVDNSFIYLTSDNGAHIEETATTGERQGGSNGKLRGGKTNCYEGGIRVPGIITYPGIISAGIDVDEPTNVMDLLPTIAGLTGSALPKDRIIDGRDLMPLLMGDTSVSPHEFMFQYCGAYLHGVRYRPRKGKVIYKLHYVTVAMVTGPDGTERCAKTYLCRCSGPTTTYHNPPIVYDLSSDPYETTPLDPNLPEINSIIKRADDAVKRHSNSIEHNIDQFSYTRMLPRVRGHPCCGLGLFPFCFCREDHSSNFTYE